MSELQDIGQIADRRARIERLRTYVHSHAYDPDGWWMLHLDLEDAGEREGSEVALCRAQAIDRNVAARFKHAPRPQPPPSSGLEVPGHRVVRQIYASDGAQLYEALDPGGARCMLRLLLGGSADSLARIMERQRLAAAYPGCVPVTKIVTAQDGLPVAVLPWSGALPIDTEGGRLPDPEGARKATAAIARLLAAPHRDGLIAGDLRPSTVLGKIDQPDSLQVLGLRRAIDGSFGTLAGDAERFRWYAAEEGAELLDARTDIYGLGLLLWWIVAGRQPPPLGERLKDRMPPTGDADLDRIIARCTQVDPADRYADVDELIRDLVGIEAPHAGPWLLGDRIGGGTGADVYRATHATDGREAFVKVFTRRQNHERELAALAAAAKVPGVVRELDASAPDAEPRYVALSPARGEALARRLARGPLEPPIATAILRRLAATVAGLHEAGVIHRDLCPDSIFVELGAPPAAPEVTVIDLDAAKLRDRPELDEPHLIGTPAYMAPEQWELVSDIDERADIYALGLVLFESIAGRHPLTGDSLIAWQRAHLEEARPPIAHPALPPHHAALIQAMISRDRARRPGTVREVIAVLDAAPPEPPKPPEPPEPPDLPPPPPPWWKRWPRDRRVQLAAGGAAIVVAGALAVALWPRNNPPTLTSLDVGAGTTDVGARLPMTCVATDPDEDPLSYRWTTSLGAIAGAGATVTLEAPSAGDAEVRCTVDDGEGHTATATAHVAIRKPGIPAVAAFEHAVVATTPSSVQVRFDNRTSGTVDGLRWRWTFGDGSSSTEESPTHTFTCTETQRAFTVTLWASNRANPGGHQITRPNLVRVTPPAPPPARVRATLTSGCLTPGRCEAWLVASPALPPATPALECTAPCRVRFESSTGGAPRRICWRPDPGAPERCGGTPSAEHTYTTPGDYLATAWSVHECGQTSTAALRLRVTSQPPWPSGQFSFVFQDPSRKWPARVTFQYRPNEAELPFLAGTTLTWSFGDGSQAQSQGQSPVVHRFADPGTYRVTLSAANPRISTTSQDLTVVGRAGARIGTIGPFGGTQGTWGPWANCPAGQVAYGFQKRVMPMVLGLDNTALNAIRLECAIPGRTPSVTTSVSSSEGPTGTWSSSLRCQGESYPRAARLRLNAQLNNDRMGAADLELRCQDGRTLAGTPATLPLGAWSPWKQCELPGGRLPDGTPPPDPGRPPVGICGIRTRVQAPLGAGDDTALNDVELACCYTK